MSDGGGLLSRQLLFVTGKGGVGKTSVAAALADLAARSGKRTLVCEMDAKGALAATFDTPPLDVRAASARPRPVGDGDEHRGLAQGVPAPVRQGPARRTHRPAGPHVRLRRRRRAGRQGDPRRRQARLRGARAALRPRRRRCRGQRAHRRPDRRPAGHPRARPGRHGPRADDVDDRDPRGPGAHRAGRRHDAGGDAGHRDARPPRAPRPRHRRHARRRSWPTASSRPSSTAARPRSSTGSTTRSRQLLVDAAGPGVRQVVAAAHVTEARRRVGNRHLERFAPGIPAGLPVLYVPELFTKATGRRVVSLVAKALADELDVDLTMPTAPQGTRRARRPAGEQGDGARPRIGRGRQDDDRRRPRAGGRRRAGRPGARPHRRPGQAPRRRARRRRARQRRVAGARRRVRGRRHHATRRAVGGDARHQGRLGRADPSPRPGRQGARRRARQPAVPEHHRAASCTATTTWRWSSCTTSTRRASTTSSSSTRRRRATPCRCSTRRRGCGEFFGSRLLRWLTVPYRSRLFTVASKPFYQIADRVLGSGFLRDIADFFVLFQAMEKGFVARAKEVEALLGDDRSTFLVVSTLETAPAHEAMYLARELLAARLRPRRDRRQPGAAERARRAVARRRRRSGSPRRRADGPARARRRRARSTPPDRPSTSASCATC